MIEERMIKSHLIVTDIHNEYHMNWLGKILDCKPQFKNGKPIFVIVGSGGRIELNTTDMKRIEHCAKLCTQPRGRTAVTSDTARIYIVQEDDTEKLMGIMTHDKVKTFAPMFDPVGYRD